MHNERKLHARKDFDYADCHETLEREGRPAPPKKKAITITIAINRMQTDFGENSHDTIEESHVIEKNILQFFLVFFNPQKFNPCGMTAPLACKAAREKTATACHR